MAGEDQNHPAIHTAQGNGIAPLATLRQAILMISLPFGILNFVLPVYGKEIGAGALQIGLFFSAFSLMTVLLRPIIGANLDRYGRRPFFLAGLAGYAVTMFAFALSDQVWAIVVARTLQGVASAFLWLTANAVTADVAGDDQRGRAFGGVDQAGNQGATLGTFVGFGVLMSLGFGTGWRLLFAGYGVVSLAALLLTWRRLPETSPLFRLWPVSDPATSARRGQSLAAPHRPIVWSRPWLLLLLVTTVTAASATMISPILMIFLQDRFAVQPETLAYAFLPYALVGALLPARLGRLADRFGRKPLMVLGLAVAAASSFVVPYLVSLVALAALWALQALCYVAGDPAERALVADLTGGDQRGRAYGLYAMMAIAHTLPAVLLGSVAGVFVDRWDRKRTMAVANLLQGLLLLVLLTVRSLEWVWLVYLVAFCESAIAQFFGPAESALLPRLVTQEHLVPANSLNALNNNLAMLAGPAIGGALMGTLGLTSVVLLNSVSYLAACVMISLARCSFLFWHCLEAAHESLAGC